MTAQNTLAIRHHSHDALRAKNLFLFIRIPAYDSKEQTHEKETHNRPAKQPFIAKVSAYTMSLNEVFQNYEHDGVEEEVGEEVCAHASDFSDGVGVVLRLAFPLRRRAGMVKYN